MARHMSGRAPYSKRLSRSFVAIFGATTGKPPPGGTAAPVGLALGAAGGQQPIDPLVSDLLRGDGQAELFFSAPAKAPRTVCGCQPAPAPRSHAAWDAAHTWSSIGAGCPAATMDQPCHGSPRSGFVFEGERYACAERGNLPVLDLHVQFRHLGHPKFPQRASRRFHRVPTRVLPRLVADTDNLDDPVDPLPAIDLLGGDGQPELLLERPGEGGPDGVRLPAGAVDDLGDGRALPAAEHRDQLLLLRALAGLPAQAPRPAGGRGLPRPAATLRRRLDRRPSAPLGAPAAGSPAELVLSLKAEGTASARRRWPRARRR